LESKELIGWSKEWPILKKYGLDSPMCNGAEINLIDGFNDIKFHDTLIKNYTVDPRSTQGPKPLPVLSST
jgi:hydroxypyruvate isomerase